jgi:hypothetical protein
MKTSCRRSLTLLHTVRPWALICALSAVVACNDDDDGGFGGQGGTTQVGTFSGLFDDVVTGYNFPFDIGIVPGDPAVEPDIGVGDIIAANYGTSELLRVDDPSGPVASRAAQSFYPGSESGLRGATAVSVLPSGTVWATFEQGGADGAGGIVVLDPNGARRALLDATTQAGAFANPGGICYGGATSDNPARQLIFFVNLGDGTAWRISAASALGNDPVVARVGAGLATGTPGNPGQPGSELSSSSDLPEGGARGCAYAGGSLYVADAQNARIMRFDGAAAGVDVVPLALEDTPENLVTYPTDVTINNEGALIVISYDNAHAFVSLELPGGGFIDNGLHDLNVNSGNYGVAVAEDTIWFTRANNSNGALRAITENQSIPPSTAGKFPPQ